MSNIFKFNSHQTPLTPELIKSLPTEVYSNLLEYIDTIEFVANLIDPDIKRVKDLPKDEEGKIVVDITIPHVLEDMDYFRAAALHFQKYGRYTLLTENPHPKSPYRLFWKEEKRRCLEGHVRPDGEWIPGDLYFYWNYCPIMLTKQLGNTKKALRVKDFPKPWLGDYLFFHYKDQADKAGKHIAMIKMRGVGAAGPDSEPVMTPDGWRTYGDINEGDLLIDRTGKPTKVLEVYPQGLSDIYEISFHDGRKVRCTSNHRWSVLDKRNCSNYKDRVLTTEEMINIGLHRKFKNNKSYNFYVPDIEPIEFTEKELTVPPYTLGYLLGDGSMNGTNLRVATNDTEVLDYILDELDDSYYFTPDKSNNNYNLNSHNRFKATKEDKKKYKNSQYGFNKIKREVELLNLNVTTGHKFIPGVYKKASIHQRLELLKGLMDADGSISKDGGMEFTNSNYTLIKDVEELCRSLGIKCKLGEGRSPRKKVIKGKECNIKQEYRLYIQTANYIPFKIKRKINRFNPNKKVFKGTSIVAIKKLDYKENARCFLVDNEEHLYLTTDFIPTHNSFKAGSLGVLRAVLRKNQKTFYTAYDKQFLNQDGVLNKSWAYLDFLAENTPFPRMRLKDSLNRMELRMGYKDLDTNAEKGSKGEIIGISSKDDPDKIRGKRGTIYFEEFGKFPKLSDTWNVCRDSTEDGEVAYDMLIAMGTGGTEGADFQGAEDMIYNPDTYNILPIRNVFDKNASDGKVCFHWGSYLNRNLCYDENGNPDVIKALLEVLTEFNNIKQTSSDSKALTQRRAEKCITIQDAVMRTEGTLFPVVDLKDYLAEIRTQGIRFFEKHYIVDLVFSGGEVKHTLTDKYPLRKYKYDPKDKEGAIEIFELPKKGVDGKPMRGRYIAGIDPYDDDEGVSLGSIIIFDLINDVIVAEYTGRPKFANDFYEICRRLCMFYNAEALYENNKKGLFTYFVQQGSVYLLADAPQTLVDQHMMKAHFNNNKRKGVHATNEINRRARMLQNDWMITSANPAYQDYDEEGNLASNKLNMHLIRSTAYLEEAIAWNPDGNFDRISSMGMVMLLREEKKQYLDNIKTNNSPTKSLAEDEYFTKEFDERFSYYEEDSYN